MAELFVSAILLVLLERLTSGELLNFATQEGVRSKLKNWEKRLKMIKALLSDSEKTQQDNEAVKLWQDDLGDLAFDAEDILDKYATEALRRKLKIEEHQASTSRARKLLPACCIACTPRDLWSDFSLRSKIDDVTRRLEDLCRQRTELGLVEIAGVRSTALGETRDTTCLPTEKVLEIHLGGNLKRQRRRKIVMSFVITNLVLELSSAVLDQVSSSVNKTQFALFGMLLSFVAMLTCIIELIYEFRTANLIWRASGALPYPWYYYRDQGCKPFGTFKDIVGLVCAFCQCVLATVSYCYIRKNANNPIKISFFPIIFAFGILFSQILKNQDTEKPSCENEIRQSTNLPLLV